jgi:hypothetical protein
MAVAAGRCPVRPAIAASFFDSKPWFAVPRIPAGFAALQARGLPPIGDTTTRVILPKVRRFCQLEREFFPVGYAPALSEICEEVQ